MAKVDFREAVKKQTLILDGAMGTQLFLRGVQAGKCSDCLNIENPQLIQDIHKAYINAGSDIIITNTLVPTG